MQKRKLILFVLPWVLVAISIFLIYRSWKMPSLPSFGDKEVIVNHHMIVEKIESMGKLELVKFYIKDIVEHEEKVDWWPDSKAILIVSGEVVGCVDLIKIDTSDIEINERSIVVTLPRPEICYNKVNHEQSRVFDISNMSFQTDANLVDKAYKLAESKLKEGAQEMNIIGQTKSSARVILKPFLESFTDKPVTIQFKD